MDRKGTINLHLPSAAPGLEKAPSTRASGQSSNASREYEQVLMQNLMSKAMSMKMQKMQSVVDDERALMLEQQHQYLDEPNQDDESFEDDKNETADGTLDDEARIKKAVAEDISASILAAEGQ